jgi:hypothetical protein
MKFCDRELQQFLMQCAIVQIPFVSQNRANYDRNMNVKSICHKIHSYCTECNIRLCNCRSWQECVCMYTIFSRSYMLHTTIATLHRTFFG